jgi:hypothetical protein
MKRIIVMLALLISSINLTADELTDYMPINVSLVMAVNVKSLMNSELYQEMLQQPEFAEKRQKLEEELCRSEMTIADIPTDVLAYTIPDGNKCGVIVRTPVTETAFKNKLDGCFKSNYQVSYTTTTFAGYNVYLIENVQSIAKTAEINNIGAKGIAVTYLAPDIAFIADSSHAEQLLKQSKVKSPQSSTNNIFPASGTLVWLMFQKSTAPSPDAASNPTEQMLANVPFNRFLFTAANATAPESKDIITTALFHCRDKNSASLLTMQLQGLLMFGLSAAFKNNPELGMELSNSLKISLQDEQVTAKLILSEPLRRKMMEYAKQQNQVVLAPAVQKTVPDSTVNK